MRMEWGFPIDFEYSMHYFCGATDDMPGSNV